MKPFYLYMLRCRGGAYYVGHTDDLEKRLAEHEAGTCGGFTAARRPVQLVYVDEFPSRDEAFSRERQLKGWTRAKKEALVRGDWAELHKLAKRRLARAAPLTRSDRDRGRWSRRVRTNGVGG